MAETFTYDPSNDPQATEAAEQRDAETLAVAEELEQQQNQLLAGKYKSAQDLEQAYIELQKKLGSNEEQDQEEQSEAEEQTEEPDEYSQIFEAADSEFFENGELSEATLEKLEGISSVDLAKAYLEYQSKNQSAEPEPVELTDQDVNTVYDSVGGQKEYQQIVEWASRNMSEDEIQAFDNVIESGNLDAIKFATQALKYRYTDSVGFEGNLIQGKAPTSTEVFRSQAEVVRAMNDPRYDQDPAYRNEIMAKLANSDLDF